MANETRIGAPLKSTGVLFSAPLGTALPTDATTALDPAFDSLGLLGDSGIEETPERSIDQIRAMGGSIARTVQTEFGLTSTYTFIERKDAVLKEVYGPDNVTITTPTGGGTLRTIKYNSKVLPNRVYVAELVDGATRIRKVYANAQITETGAVSYVHSNLIMYEVTQTSYEDDFGNNEYEYEFTPGAAAA